MSRGRLVNDNNVQPLRAVRTKQQGLLNIRGPGRPGDPVDRARQGAWFAAGIGLRPQASPYRLIVAGNIIGIEHDNVVERKKIQ